MESGPPSQPKPRTRAPLLALLGRRRSRAAWRHGGPTRSPSRCGAARQCSHGRRRLLVAGCARSLCMSLAPIVAAAPMTATANPRHSSRMRGAAAAAARTSLRPCGRVRPRAERLPARSGQRDQEGPLLEPYSSYPSRASRGTLVRPVQGIKKKPKYARPWPTTPACDRAERT